MSIVTAEARTKSVKRVRAAAKAKTPKPKAVITPGEAWVMVNKLKINVEYQERSGRWVATFRNKAIYLPVPGTSAFAAVQELLAQIDVEVAHG